MFKRLFGKVGNENITKGLLNAILDDNVEEITLDNNTITEKDLYDDKVGILDIKAVLNNNIQCDIEMQVVEQENIEKRILFYWSKMYIASIKSGNKYEELKKSIVILITEFEIEKLKDLPKSHTEWGIREKDAYILLTDVLEIHIISLSKIKRLMEKGKLTKSDKKIEKWARFFLSPKSVRKQDMENDESMKELIKEYESVSADEHERYLAELRMKYIMDKQAELSYSHRTGVEEGHKEKAIEIAEKMLEKNSDIEFIAECTGLTKEEIENLK